MGAKFIKRLRLHCNCKLRAPREISYLIPRNHRGRFPDNSYHTWIRSTPALPVLLTFRRQMFELQKPETALTASYSTPSPRSRVVLANFRGKHVEVRRDDWKRSSSSNLAFRLTQPPEEPPSRFNKNSSVFGLHLHYGSSAELDDTDTRWGGECSVGRSICDRRRNDTENYDRTDTPKWSLCVITVSKRMEENLLKHIFAEIDTKLRKPYGRNEVFPPRRIVLLYNFRLASKNDPVGRERRMRPGTTRNEWRIGNFKKKYWLNSEHITNCIPKFENYNTGLLYWRTKMFKTVCCFQVGLRVLTRRHQTGPTTDIQQ